ncbi:MAG: HIRAN domain-containing protein [Bacteroidetes bacterium]|nr:HIRAN domain-containing protein [Bacteroidota bacterium]
MNDRHFSTFHIAGFTYYNGVDLFENLKIGTQLSLKAEPENAFDPNAVAIYYQEEKLGFVPRDENPLLRKFLNLGYTDLFEIKISQVSPETHPEKQIRVVVRIKEK